MKPNALDHVALWVSRRDEVAAFLCDHLGMHEIEHTDTFTLVGADARRGKVTLFDADGPRDNGALERIVLRVADLPRALRALPTQHHVEQDGAVAKFEGPEQIGFGLVQRTDTDLDYDLDHVVLALPDPDAAAPGFEQLGFERRNGDLAVRDKWIRLMPGGSRTEHPLLNHIALLVDSAAAVEAEARARGIEIEDVKDAANTLAVFVWGPGSVKLEYVEHKPGFSLV